MRKGPAWRRWLITGHAWAGFAASLLLVVVGASGTALVFKDDWIRFTVADGNARLRLDDAALAAAAASAESAFGAARVTAIKFATPDLGVHRVYLADGGGAYLDGAGRVVDRWPANGRLEDWLLHLHFKLLAGTAGEIVVGVLGLIAIALAVSGLVLWWRARKAYRHRFVPRSSDRGELLAVHRNTGVWGALPVIVLCLSGITMIFDEPSAWVLNAVFGTAAPRHATAASRPSAPTASRDDVSRVVAAAQTGGGTSTTPGPGGIDWRDVFVEGRALFPRGVPRIASWPGEGGNVVVRYKQPAEWHPNGRSTLTYDPGKGRAAGYADATRFGLGEKVDNAMYPLHSARIGGPLLAVFVALSGLMLTSLGVIGAWSFLKGRKATWYP